MSNNNQKTTKTIVNYKQKELEKFAEIPTKRPVNF